MVDRDPLIVEDPGYRRGVDRDDDDMLVQDGGVVDVGYRNDNGVVAPPRFR